MIKDRQWKKLRDNYLGPLRIEGNLNVEHKSKKINRLRYAKPTLVSFGSIAVNTNTKASGVGDGGGNNKYTVEQPNQPASKSKPGPD